MSAHRPAPLPPRQMVRLTDTIEYAVSDVGTGPPVLLLHGFPSTADMWEHQVPALVDAGFRVVAPDLRGCGGSSKPADVDSYKLLRIAGDLSLLLQRLEIPQAHVVAHDWGAVLAWLFAATMPRKVDHLVCISVGHPSAYVRPPLLQRRASWYVLLFMFEGIAEALLAHDDWDLFREFMTAGGLTEEQVDECVERYREPGALTAGLNWYRANWHPRTELEGPLVLPPIRHPTLTMWGTGDLGTLEAGVVASADHVTGPWRHERIDDATHWVPMQQPDRVNELLLGFLGRHASVSSQRVRRSF
jgi:pimeloyl-ACP methyl ester carboxylesterase